MSMTRRDYEVIAGTIKYHHFDVGNLSGQVRLQASLACHMADNLAPTNPRFDWGKFVERCKPVWLDGSRHEATWDAVVERWWA